MANEIKITRTINYENGALKYTYSPGTLSLPQATRGYTDQTVSVTSAEADYAVTAAAAGMTLLRSLEATTTGKTVIYGTTEGLVYSLPPKREAVFQLASTTGVLAMMIQGALVGPVYVQRITFEA